MRAYDITKSTQDLRYLTWDERSQPSGLAMVEPTAREGTGSRAVIYRLPSRLFRETRLAVEAVNELVACRLMDFLGVPHVDTRLINALVCIDGQECNYWLSRYKGLRAAGEQAVPLDLFFELRGERGESPLDMCVRMGWAFPVAQIMLVDYLTANRGRSGNELRVLRDNDGHCSLAPIMGGRYALASAFASQTWRVNATADLSTANYLGAQSLEENLQWAVGVFKDVGKFPGDAFVSTPNATDAFLTQDASSASLDRPAQTAETSRLCHPAQTNEPNPLCRPAQTADGKLLCHPERSAEGKLPCHPERSAEGAESKDLVPTSDASPAETGTHPACASEDAQYGAPVLPPATLPASTRKALFRALDDVYNPMLGQLEGSWQVICRRWEYYARLCRL